MLALDHLAVGCSSLAEGTAWVENQLGVTLEPGGKHTRYGTHNALLGLADGLYLEVIAIDPEASPEAGHAWFGLDHFTGPPRLINWICRADDFADAPVEAGPPQSLHRGDLSWQIAVPDDGNLPFDGGYPTLIQWAAGTSHPAARLAKTGCKLTAFEISHPQAAELVTMMQMDDERITLRPGPLGMRARFDTPTGPKVLA